MKIGMTYDLRSEWLAQGLSEVDAAEFDSPQTIDAIAGALSELGHEPVRIGGLRALVTRLAAGDRWDLVFNIAEGRGRFGRESQVPALLEGYGIPFTFSDALVCALTLHKGMAKHVLRDRGIPTPEFAVVERIEEVAQVTLPFPLFCKPVAEGTSKGVTADCKVDDHDALRRICKRLLVQFGQPVLVERFLPGRELTVGVLGTGEDARAVGALGVELLETAEPNAYTYENKEAWPWRVSLALATGDLAAEASDLAERAWRALGCQDGGRVDLRQNDRGRLEVIELNPLPGLKPGHSDLPLLCEMAGIGYGELIRRIVESACARLPHAAKLRV
jgi:D-alanine-D-alanine ligase